jgi:hypothetical protein
VRKLYSLAPKNQEKLVASPLLYWVAMNRKTATRLGLLGIFSLLISSFPARAYEEIAVNNGATIRGSVKIEGKLPKPPPLQITKFKEV